jgi:hypothetical protein
MLIDHTPRKYEGGTPRNAFILKNTKKDEGIAPKHCKEQSSHVSWRDWACG